MFKTSLLWFVILCSMPIVFADELQDGCEPAVDAADRLSPGDDNHCDYSKTGLNGILHKAFAKNEKTSENKNNDVSTSSVTKNTLSHMHMVSREFESALQLMAVRYDLLQLSVLECAKGFAIERERYLPVNAQRMKLELYYICLE